MRQVKNKVWEGAQHTSKGSFGLTKYKQADLYMNLTSTSLFQKKYAFSSEQGRALLKNSDLKCVWRDSSGEELVARLVWQCLHSVQVNCGKYITVYGSNILSLHDSDIFFTVNFLCLRGWCRRDLGYPEQPQQVGHLKQGGWRSTWNWEGAGQPETEKLQVNLKSGVLPTEIGWLHPKIGCLPSQIGCIHPEIGCLLNKIGYPHPLLRCLFNEIGCL